MLPLYGFTKVVFHVLAPAILILLMINSIFFDATVTESNIKFIAAMTLYIILSLDQVYSAIVKETE